ncbi:hypothetical protein GCM10011613_03580 [Cellvibrio zantedeschiae]|uniref:Cytochrome oxidase maturation protein, cbb3-type n=1 Tax=Cellvibrio zantedeschiae TaxID=1237077 RepID=A0ABQ3AT01_9GAMM|nr:cbb3-type cytochrome oxidase assembly protein CcoS [Cellvibrio zantedeschiae]GGY63209.1 hypothetical protein GCM10011613_03580 [Cellvibrio zantedeschiae]
MESLYFLVPCALIFIAIAVKVLFWAINNGQYDNLDTEAHRILFDNEKSKTAATQKDVFETEELLKQDQPEQKTEQHK